MSDQATLLGHPHEGLKLTKAGQHGLRHHPPRSPTSTHSKPAHTPRSAEERLPHGNPIGRYGPQMHA
jgi:hypothetical protein